MIKIVMSSITIGGILGYFVLPESFLSYSEYIIVVGLSALLFFVGMDIGRSGTVFKHIKEAGIRVIAFPIATIIGTLCGSLICSLFLPISANEAMAVGAGFGWYSLAPLLIDPYSQTLSAMSFLHNVIRETLGIMLVPILAKYVGYIETTSLPGAAAMDVCLPVVERSTNAEIAVYSFISGLALSASVPILVPIFLGL